MSSQETRRAVAFVYVQRRLGLCARVFAATARISGFGIGRKRTHARRHDAISKQRYERLGVPYHRSYLLYGPPGTGKTSLVSALAAHFGLSIYIINLADFNDRSLMGAVDNVPANSILLLEDIDCMKGTRSRIESDSGSAQSRGATLSTKEVATNQNGVTLSGWLNVLDGFAAPTGVLFVMTTKYVEKLGPALLRPGRIDYRLYLGKASERQKVELYLRFFPKPKRGNS